MEHSTLSLDVVEKGFKSLFEDFDSLKKLVDNTEMKSKSYLVVKNTFAEKRPILKSFEDKKYYIAFIGPYSVGKSTFINALLEREILPEKLEIATTAFPTYLIPANGKDENAIIYYSTTSERESLKKFYIKEIESEIASSYYEEMALNELPVDDLVDSINEIQEKLKEDEIPYHTKLFTPLMSLLSKWGEKVDEKVDKKVEEIKDFVESNDDSIIITKAEVYLNTPILSTRSDIVLVDLPGVDADNKRHYETTHNFTITDAKAHAYIVVTAPDKIDSGVANKYLRALGKNSKHLSKAFWVINKSDTSPDILVTKKDLIKKIGESSIVVNNQRIYTTSALLYKQLKKGDEDVEKEHYSIINSVSILRDNLESYLTNVFVNEFLETKKEELDYLQSKILGFLETKVGKYIGLSDNEAAKLYEIEYVEEKVAAYLKNLRGDFKEVNFTINEKIQSLDFFNDELMKKLKERISQEIDEVEGGDDLLKIERPRDVNSSYPELMIRKIQGEVKLNEYIRKEYKNALNEEGDVATLLSLPSILLGGDQFKLELIEEKITKAIQGKQLNHRFDGICDILLIGYGNIFNNLLSLILKTDKNKNLARIYRRFKTNLYTKVSFTYSESNSTVWKRKVIDLLDSTGYTEFQMKNVVDEYELGKEELTDIQFKDYQKGIVKIKFYLYIDKLKNNANKYVNQCIVNHFKELNLEFSSFIGSKELENQIRLKTTMEINSSESKKNDISNKRLAFISLYNRLKNFDLSTATIKDE